MVEATVVLSTDSLTRRRENVIKSTALPACGVGMLGQLPSLIHYLTFMDESDMRKHGSAQEESRSCGTSADTAVMASVGGPIPIGHSLSDMHMGHS